MRWFTYARPFARRIRAYRKRRAGLGLDQFERIERIDDYILAIQYAWAEFVSSVILKEHP